MRILIIEDEKEISKLLKSSLEEECFAVDVADDGEKGLFLSNTNEYDLILLDYILPKKTGKELCMEIREKKNVPIIMLSVKSDTLTKVEVLDLGADDYITKPFSFTELLSRIKAVLRRPRETENTILEAGNLFLDTKKHLLKKKGEEITLRKKEFMLLELLMKKKGEPVSRGIIMEHVWDINADPFSNTIETHILSLRKKIEEKGEKLIFTIPGVGYKIGA